MKPEEINRVIAEFMGLHKPSYNSDNLDKCDICGKYRTQCELINNNTARFYQLSLDALVPVWEKLKVETSLVRGNPLFDQYFCHIKRDVYKFYGVHDFKRVEITESAPTQQEAAALATAKAILELTDKQEEK